MFVRRLRIRDALFAILLLTFAMPALARTCSPVPPPVAAVSEDHAQRQPARETEYQHFVAKLAATSDLRVRVAIPVTGMVRCDDGQYFPTPDATLPSLVELARGSTDPMILATLAARCDVDTPDGHPPCDALALADRWTIADSQNAAAWVMLASMQSTRGDLAGEASSVARAAQAPSWHDYQIDRQRVLLHALRDAPDRAALETRLLRSVELPVPPLVSPAFALSGTCRAGMQRDACDRILDTLCRDAADSTDLTICAMASARSGASDAVVRARQQREDALHWADVQTMVHALETAPDGDKSKALLAWVRTRIEVGEVATGLAWLAAEKITESEAAQRQLERMDPARRSMTWRLRGMSEDGKMRVADGKP